MTFSHMTLFRCLLGTDFVAMVAIDRCDLIGLMCQWQLDLVHFGKFQN